MSSKALCNLLSKGAKNCYRATQIKLGIITVPVLRLGFSRTALYGLGGHLEGDKAARGLWYVHPKHQANARVLPADVRLAVPLLNVGVPQLEDPSAVDPVGGGEDGHARQTSVFSKFKSLLLLFSVMVNSVYSLDYI